MDKGAAMSSSGFDAAMAAATTAARRSSSTKNPRRYVSQTTPQPTSKNGSREASGDTPSTRYAPATSQ